MKHQVWWLTNTVLMKSGSGMRPWLVDFGGSHLQGEKALAIHKTLEGGGDAAKVNVNRVLVDI